MAQGVLPGLKFVVQCYERKLIHTLRIARENWMFQDNHMGAKRKWIFDRLAKTELHPADSEPRIFEDEYEIFSTDLM